MNHPDPTLPALADVIREAETLGADAGRAAASWFEMPTARAAQKVLTGIEDGDPEILDSLPFCDLSGQWADGLTTQDIIRDAMNAADADGDLPEGAEDEVVDAFVFAFDSAVRDAVESAAQYLVRPDTTCGTCGYDEETSRTFTLTIECDNAAFSGDMLTSELVRILEQIARDVARGETERWVRDVNGNKVGAYKLATEQQD